MKKSALLQAAVCFLLAATLCVLSVCYAIPALTASPEDETSQKGVVRLWNIDTFEGGKGSRTAYLNRISAAYEKTHPDVYVMVSSYTAEGARAALEEGDAPEMISFGIGFSEIAEKCLKINGRFFSGGEIGGECRAVPWCRGGYALYCLQDDFSSATSENTVVSSGGCNLPAIAAAFLPLSGKLCVEESASAYVRFLAGKYRYLLGTQRDACRLAARGVNAFCRPIEGFSDLWQYIAVLAGDEESRSVCDGFVETLLSPTSQKRLTEIGMLSPYFDVYDSEDGLHDLLESAKIGFTLDVFASAEGLRKADEAARAAVGDGNAEVLKNFLKTIRNTSQK